MSIFEYDEEKEMAMYGEAERLAGEYKKLISQVRKKKEKGLDAKEIADMLEEDEQFIRRILEIILSNPAMEDEDIARIL